MNTQLDYLQKNKEAWNLRTDHHMQSAFYDVDGFLKGKNSLNEIELSLLGNVTGLRILHLQCHFGQDTLSLGRMGAIVTGVDLSDNAISRAMMLADNLKSDAKFICCDLYELGNYLEEEFDIVFTSYGTISWFPDLDKWAAIISRFLKPGGKFVFAEFHPVVWMFDNDFEKIAYNYAKSEPIVEIEQGTYADKSAPISTEMITWNHSIAEVLTSLLSQGLEIISFDEFDYSPYKCLNKMIEFQPGKFRIAHLGNRIPLVYALSAKKKWANISTLTNAFNASPGLPQF